MLVHICCSVDSHFFLEKLQNLYPNEKLIGFFYDPNIHPYSEYKLRLLDVQRSCKKLGVELLEGEYDYDGWIEAVRGLEDEPEKGKRCTVCFDNRLEMTAKKALELGIKSITTTLLTSPKKSIEQLKEAASEIEARFNIIMHTPDFRKNGGTSEQFLLAKEAKLYHQNYCGCLFALTAQRQGQKKLASELMSSIGRQILPSSIEERIELYETIVKLELKQEKFMLRREKFLNYRLLFASVKKEGYGIPTYPLFYSHIKREKVKGEVEFIRDDVGYFSKESVVFMTLKKFNYILKTEYKSVKELIFHPVKVKKEMEIRALISGGLHSISPIFIVDVIPQKKLEISMQSNIYEDVRELLVIN